MKEIGGFLEFERNASKSSYYSNLVELNSARNSLLYVCKTKKITKLYIPFYLCDSVENVCCRREIEVEYYYIKRDFTPDFSGHLKENEYLYVVNYFGLLTDHIILKLKNRFNRIIVDNVQAFFQKPLEGIDTIYSCRKFFGVPDGSYLSTDKLIDGVLPLDHSAGRFEHIFGRFEKTASEYYSVNQKNEKLIDGLPLRQMSLLTENLMNQMDYLYIKEKREINFNYLHEELKEINILNLENLKLGPYCYPFFHENGMEIKKKLISQRIYVPTLWPNLLDLPEGIEREYTENIIPLPCDQRYSMDDLSIMIKYLRNLI